MCNDEPEELPKSGPCILFGSPPRQPQLTGGEWARRCSGRLGAADNDFIEGMSFSLAAAIGFLALVLAAGFAWFPRGNDFDGAELGPMVPE